MTKINRDSPSTLLQGMHPPPSHLVSSALLRSTEGLPHANRLRFLGPGRSDDWVFAIPELRSTLGLPEPEAWNSLATTPSGDLFLIVIIIIVTITTPVLIMANY